MPPMFDTTGPRIFAEPCGIDFTRALIKGLRDRLGPEAPPEALARSTLIVNTSRMREQLIRVFAERPGLLPRIHLVTEIEALAPGLSAPAAIPPLHLQLDLAQLTRQLLLARPGLAPPSAAFSLAGTLQRLLAEMQEEGVSLADLRRIDPQDLADHWQQSLSFLQIIDRYLAPTDPAMLTAEGRAQSLLADLAARWSQSPPQAPVILAGSTGSRGPTRALMEAVLALPQGAMVLPGVDLHTPAAVWEALVRAGREGRAAMEDHPQYRVAMACAHVGKPPSELTSWSQLTPPSDARNRLISLALRPAPVTNQWRQEGPELISSLPQASEGLTLLLAPSPREEAAAIALGLRAALEAGRSAALMTPDRGLARQVTAALDRWRLRPDDSAGRPLGLTAQGRLLRLLAGARGRRVSAEALLILLKQPMVAAAKDLRGPHLMRTRTLERQLIRGKTPFPTPQDLHQWAEDKGQDRAWAAWVGRMIDALAAPAEIAPLAQHHGALVAVLDLVLRGPTGQDPQVFWDDEAGAKTRELLQELGAAAAKAGEMSGPDFAATLSELCANQEVRNANLPHPDVMIWGAMEARLQTADLVILGGLNEGIWPDTDSADPWLNRAMRAQVGLRLPDRTTGLSAHDWQQAVAGREIWLSRSLRSDEAETVPSRWLNRLTNLLGGLGPEGKATLEQITAKGAHWMAMARPLDRPARAVPPAPRPAPAPPIQSRPSRLSVTQIETLIRDPYAIYAAKVLNLAPQPPLRMSPDARIRGTVIHDALSAFAQATTEGLPPDPLALLTQVLDQELVRSAPWPAMRRLWRAKLLKVAPWFLAQEALRRQSGHPAVIEEKGALSLQPQLDFTLTAKADRIDILEDGSVAIFDYKTGAPPTADVQKTYNKQLPLEALIVAGGGFGDLGAREVSLLRFIGFGSGGTEVDAEVSAQILAEHHAGLVSLIQSYATRTKGYTARRAVTGRNWAGDYDHLARHGEWDDTTPVTTLRVGP